MQLIKNILKKNYITIHDAFFPNKLNFFEKKNLREKLIQEEKINAFSHEDLKNAIKEQFKEYMKCDVNLDNPVTFQDKMAWLKLYFQNPVLTTCADKFTATNYVKNILSCSDDFFVKSLGAFQSVSEINFAALPNSFVLKSNWGSGVHIIVKDKKNSNIPEIKSSMKTWLYPCMNHYYCAYEYSYKNIKPKIICEELLDFEYKLEFHCFNGKPQFVWTVFNDKTSQVAADFRNMNWERMPIKHKYPNTENKIEKPNTFEEMGLIAHKLSKDFPFVRVDFYKTKDSFKFSELTFYPWAGLQPFTPREYDTIVGEMITLPNEVIIEKK